MTNSDLITGGAPDISGILPVINKTVQDFFKKTGFEAEIKISKEGEKTILVEIKTEEPKILIGQNGQTLSEIQHLLKAILRRKIRELSGGEPAEPFYLNLDINDYKKKKIEYLKEIADSMADEVALSKKEKLLFPMPAHERRIIHLELAKREDIITESIGEGPDRRIAIRPKT